jgi:hypothetical protein
MVDLDAMVGTGRFFQMCHARHGRRTRSVEKLAKAIHALGGIISVSWH